MRNINGCTSLSLSCDTMVSRSDKNGGDVDVESCELGMKRKISLHFVIFHLYDKMNVIYVCM